MHIAYISFEHPLGESGGGIGIYVDQIATIMASRQHQVAVFTTSKASAYAKVSYKNYQVHTVPATNIDDFRNAVVPIFETEHQQTSFDVIESAEYGADGLMIKKLHPEIPLVVKLHTPGFLVNRLNFKMPSLWHKIRFMAGGLLRGRVAKPYWIESKKADNEKEIYDLADQLTSPSLSLAQIVKAEWGERDITVLPNPYIPSQAMLNVVKKGTDKKCRILFIGRLEPRKGIFDLVKAIPMVLKADSYIMFDFAGSDQPSNKTNVSVKALVTKKLGPYMQNIQFLGYVDNSGLANLFSDTDICVFPSIWENFPNVCLESMSAGLPVIASRNGGMAEIITDEKDGLLISPGAPHQIAAAILKLANDNLLRLKLGSAARQTILERYNANEIGAAAERVFRKAIDG